MAGPGNRVGGAVVGGLLGGLIGNRIGAAMDDEDKQRAYAAQIDALERAPSGAPVSWKNPDSGRYGTVVPSRPIRMRPELPFLHPHDIH